MFSKVARMQDVDREDGQDRLSIPKYSTSRMAAIAVGISLPRNILGRIDADRGDISRSRFVLRIIERVYSTADHDTKMSSVNDCKEIQG